MECSGGGGDTVSCFSCCWIIAALHTAQAYETCVGILGIQDICHFAARVIGYYPFYFQGYGILCSIFWLHSGILNI